MLEEITFHSRMTLSKISLQFYNDFIVLICRGKHTYGKEFFKKKNRRKCYVLNQIKGAGSPQVLTLGVTQSDPKLLQWTDRQTGESQAKVRVRA